MDRASVFVMFAIVGVFVVKGYSKIISLRKWPDDLRYRYSELVNSVVNTEGKASYEITGAQGGIRTHTPDKGKRILSPSP